jgi:biotin carboxyl carrier protein
MSREKKFHTLPGGEGFVVELAKEDAGYVVRSSSPPFVASVVRSSAASGSAWSVIMDGKSYEAKVERDNGEILVEVAGERFRFGSGAERQEGATAGRRPGRREVKAPMPGRVVKLLAASGETVTAGQAILLFEAMKMQNEMLSPQDGVLVELAVQEGQTIQAQETLFVVRSD